MKQTGILLPIFSLYNKYGIGTLGKQAYKFIDFLKQSKQNLWQILPTNPTSFGDSPYQSFSSFAYNPYFFDLELLVEDKLLSKASLKRSGLKNDSNYIDYGTIFNKKLPLLKKIYKRHKLFNKEFKEYKKLNKYWLVDYALFMVLKEKHNYSIWATWEDKYKYRSKKALKEFYNENKKEVETYMFIQFIYYRQWSKLKDYAKNNDVKIIGDMPIYVAFDSVDVWANPILFMLNQDYYPTLVAGVPPDYFSSTGQLWGNPLYRYDKMKLDNYKWWNKRIANALSMFDYVRIDHFRGFSAFYAIDYNETTALNGKWIKGPGMDLFKVINRKNNNPSIIAENLGLLDDDVNKLIKNTKYPGMKILQFEVYDKDNINFLKENNTNNIFYPGTHDNNTFISWYNEEASKKERGIINKELKLSKRSNITNCLIRYSYKFNMDYIIIMMQDILGLDFTTRINKPGTSSNNWTYMFNKNVFNKKLANKLARYKEKYVK